MNKEQTLNILEAIQTNYTHFNIDQKKLNFWAFAMQEMDYEAVTKKLMQHVTTVKYAPTIAEIAAYKPKENNYLKELEQREIEAEQVPQEVKDLFKEAFDELIRKKTK